MIAGQRKLRILIVENEMLLQLAAEDMLQELGHEVVGWANRAKLAIAETERARPDVVLMDIQLDGTRDGIETAHQIHCKFGIPSLFMTGSNDAETYSRALKAEPVGYLQKPLWLPDLKSALAQIEQARAHTANEDQIDAVLRNPKSKSNPQRSRSPKAIDNLTDDCTN